MSPASTRCTPQTSPALLRLPASSPTASVKSTTSSWERSRLQCASFKSGKSTLTGRGSDSLYKVAYDYINSHGKDLHGQPLGQYFIHGLGHYVGLEVHDPGDNTAPIPRGAVFTVEPGIYIPEEKLGVRIEDIVWINRDGKLMNFTESLPHTAEEIEAAMAGNFKPKQ